MMKEVKILLSAMGVIIGMFVAFAIGLKLMTLIMGVNLGN